VQRKKIKTLDASGPGPAAVAGALREDFVVFGQVPAGQTTPNDQKNIANLPKDVSPERGGTAAQGGAAGRRRGVAARRGGTGRG
jgi:hypothetical protein